MIILLKLVRLSAENYPLLCEMMDEWTASEAVIIPRAISKADYHDYDNYSQSIEVKSENSQLVPDSTFFCLDTERNIFVGAVNIRHYLNDRLMNIGHIGDGIRPSERRKGYGTLMVGLALDECRKLGLDKVLMVCDKVNVASAKTIIKNGGILENEPEIDGRIICRFIIDL